MKTNEDRMIDFVAKSYEENRFDPQKASVSVAELVVRRSSPTIEARRPISKSGHFGRLSGRNLSLRHLVGGIAGIAAAALVGIFLYTSWRSSWTDYTAYDIPQTFILPDSSSVTLAPGATLRLQKHKDKRLVRMTGKVYFNVRHDDGAPFRVDAGDGFVKVLGTRFQVDAPATSVAEPMVRQGTQTSGIPKRIGDTTCGHFDRLSDLNDPDPEPVEGSNVTGRRKNVYSGKPDGCVSVSVISGRVLFLAAQSSEGLILTKGRNAVLEPASAKPVEITPKHPNPAAWATGEFVYDNTPLPEVISELSDYYGVRLTVADGSAVHSLSGEFSTASLSDILSLIDSALGVTILVE